MTKSGSIYLRKHSFPAKFSSLQEISAFIRETCVKAGLDEATCYKVQLSVDEACANIIEHAYGDDLKGDIVCICNVTPTELIIQLQDHGRSFNPGAVDEPDINANLEERKVGGLGLYLIKKLMDEVTFFSIPSELGGRSGGNFLILVKRKDISHE